jgi:rod shape-determining protein MreC
LSRFQIILFSSLTAVALAFLLLSPAADLKLSTGLSSVLLLPIRVVSRYVEYLTVSRDRIEKLERDLTRLTLENAELNDRLSTDSITLVPAGYRLIRAKVIGRDPTNFNGFLYIDRNRRDSLAPGQPVIINNGLVGRVKYAGTFSSIVETIENRGLAVSARDTRTGVQGIVKQENGLILDYIKIPDPIEAGDTIVTSGMSENFPAGIIIATVLDVRETGDLLFKKVSLRPCVPVNRLNYLYVIKPDQNVSAPDTERVIRFDPLWDMKPVMPRLRR